MPPGHACHAVLNRFALWGVVRGVHTVVFIDLTYLAARLRSMSDAPVHRLRSWQQSNTESLIELLASLRSAEKLRAEPAVESQVCLDLPQGRMLDVSLLVDQPLSPLMSNLPRLLPARNPLQLNGAQSL